MQELARLIYGKHRIRINDKYYVIVNPSPHVIYLAEEKRGEMLEKYKFEEWMSPNQITNFLVRNGVIDQDIDGQIEQADSTIEDLKVQLFGAFYKPKMKEDIRKRLGGVKEFREQLICKRKMFDNITLGGFADSIKMRFIFAHTIYYNKKKLFRNYSEADNTIINVIVDKYVQNRLTEEKLRWIARNEPWRTYWSIQGIKLFKGYLNDEQRALIAYSKMYTNAYRHPHSPCQEIIDDDDSFDGWMISLRREREKEQTSDMLEKTGVTRKSSPQRGKIPMSGDVFLPRQSQDEANEVYQMNDFSGKMVIKERNAVIKQKGKVEDANMPDKRRELVQTYNEIMRNRKGK